ncbi:MAG: FecR family protein [Bacteroidales bacterium]|nr:FecR family protein [Bacteroidales bacterium]
MNKELLEKYCKNACTKEELSSVLKWFEESSGTSEGKALLSKIWEELPENDSDLKINFDIILDKIHHKVNLAQSQNLLEEADQNLILYKRRKHFISILSRAAAILMLPVLGFGLYMSSKYQSIRHDQIAVNQAYNEVISSVDAITKVSLPDGSNVWLNHRSKLKYPAMFQGNSRTVELTGEGYFEVAHNPKIPFIVKAGEIQVLARGTTFNILAYPDEDRVETSLINGNVELQRLDANKNSISLLKMKPADLAIYKKSDKKIITRSIEDERYYSWKDGKLIFKKEPMSEVVKKLGRWFNVDIKIKDPELFELTYTATFEQETLPQVMELLTMVTPINYSISNRKEASDGTFSKRKVVLTYCRRN